MSLGPCLAVAELSGYSFPDPRDPGRFEDIPGWCSRQAGQYRIIWVGDLWERATFMRGMQEILLDLVTAPAFVEALLAQHVHPACALARLAKGAFFSL